jgi:hypothetical protein
MNMDEDEIEEPEIEVCYRCGYVFTEGEIRWVSPFTETLCLSCYNEG